MTQPDKGPLDRILAWVKAQDDWDSYNPEAEIEEGASEESVSNVIEELGNRVAHAKAQVSERDLTQMARLAAALEPEAADRAYAGMKVALQGHGFIPQPEETALRRLLEALE